MRSRFRYLKWRVLVKKSKEILDLIKCGEFVDKMNDVQLLSKDVFQGIIQKIIYHPICPRIKTQFLIITYILNAI